MECPKCGRKGQYHTSKLIGRFGGDYPMPDLRLELTGCTQRTYSDYCGVFFSDALAVHEAKHGPIKSK